MKFFDKLNILSFFTDELYLMDNSENIGIYKWNYLNLFLNKNSPTWQAGRYIELEGMPLILIFLIFLEFCYKMKI
jgi:hypothetical protein